MLWRGIKRNYKNYFGRLPRLPKAGEGRFSAGLSHSRAGLSRRAALCACADHDYRLHFVSADTLCRPWRKKRH